ncbi:hypothetical protein [Litchfieldia salsa]|uniref:Uncharacterized protein n=1 Tax=Litchfieldia salsa TaxID=930152 RepID=A0A1H0UYG7_9BACI|nr:hypothetical protein [Litchfieldia salsa]SDP70886.1 hypothetical protein SAMN05216565_105234 [Litchfieldia salsa]
MNQLLQSILEKTRESVEQTTHLIVERIETLLHEPTFSVEELASFVASHPNTSFSQKFLLGIHYYFYELKLNNMVFYLETKGTNGSYILELLITNETKTLFQFYSYENKLKPTKPLKLSETINREIN